MCVQFSPSGQCFLTNIAPPLVIEFHISGRLTGNRFLSRISILTHNIDIAKLPVCPFVCNVPELDENGLTYRHSFFHHTVAQSF